MSTTNEMKRRGRAVIEAIPLPQPAEVPATVTDPLLLERLDQISQDHADLRGMLSVVMLRLEHTPASAVACEQAATKMVRAADAVTGSVPLLQAGARRNEEAATEIVEHGEGRLRRLAAALILTCSLSSVLGNVWLAWKANLL